MWSTAHDGGLIAEIGAALGHPVEDVAPLASFAELVATWNARVNLTGAKEPRALAEILFADALVLAELVPQGARVVDVGAGGGAPAIPLAIARPDLSVTLLEPRRLRASFLRTAIGALELGARVTAEEKKLVTAAPWVGRFDVALSRATFEPAEWLARGIEIAETVIVLGRADPLPEHPRAERVRERDYALPFSGAPRRIGVYARKR